MTRREIRISRMLFTLIFEDPKGSFLHSLIDWKISMKEDSVSKRLYKSLATL